MFCILHLLAFDLPKLLSETAFLSLPTLLFYPSSPPHNHTKEQILLLHASAHRLLVVLYNIENPSLNSAKPFTVHVQAKSATLLQ